MKLESEGWNVEVASDGEAGLRRALEDPPSLVLLDLLLPRMDGIEVLRQIRGAADTRTVPVLILSNALGISGREREARALGIVDWVVKANTTPAAATAQSVVETVRGIARAASAGIRHAPSRIENSGTRGLVGVLVS